MTDRDERTEKIKKLLAKAEGTDNEHEAEAFREHAYRLMIQYEISDAQLRATDGEVVTEPIIRENAYLVVPKSYAYEFISTMADVVEAHGMGAYIGKTNVDPADRTVWLKTPMTFLIIVGFQSDVTRVRLLVDSLLVQLNTALATYGRGLRGNTWMNGSDRWNEKRSFVRGYGWRLRERIRETRARTVEAEATPGTALALVDKTAQVTSWVDQHMSIGKGRTRQVRHSGADAGSRAANHADLGQSRFGTGARGALEG
jgi:hypothetical protein